MVKNTYCNKSDLSNEDSVEKFFLDRLINKLGFEDKEIKTKKSIQELTISKGGRKKENYKPDYVLYKDGKPLIVVEAKAVEEDIKEFEYQPLGYAFALNKKYKNENPVRYCLLSNGYLTNLYNWDEEKPILSMKCNTFFPSITNSKLLNSFSFSLVFLLLNLDNTSNLNSKL